MVELAGDSTFDYIEVAGTLRASRLHDTRLRFIHLIVLPGGVLDIGTSKDPIPCGTSVLFMIRNAPIDLTVDPYQWSNGLVNFGRETRVGCAKTAFAEVAESLAARATQVTLATAPSGWQVGDELLIPDTAVPSVGKPATNATAYVSRRETAVTIANISGSSLTLSKPLDFEHNAVTAPNGKVVVRPRVANLTRNIVIRSEDQLGTRGHTVDIGRGASWDVEYNAFIDLGRTLAQPLDNTALPHAGTNQVGKYVEHHHHIDSAVGSVDIGNVYRGNQKTTKWALVVHGTSDVLVQDCIAVDFPAAGFVTEDGYEVRNVFRHNLAAYIGGNPTDALGFGGQTDFNAGCPGCEGSGFWFHSVMNTIVGNEAWNSYRGINLFNQHHELDKYPSTPGAMPDTPNNNHAMLPLEMRDNLAVGNSVAGFEFWAVRRFANVNLTVANNRQNQTVGVQSDGIEHYYQNVTAVCPQSPGLVSYGIHADFSYTGTFEMEGGYVGGCTVGVTGGGGSRFEKLHGTTLQNVLNIQELPLTALFDRVIHLPLGNLPHRYIWMNDANFNAMGGPTYIWNGTDPLPDVGSASRWVAQRGSQFIIKDWQGTGMDYRLFTLQQLGNNPAWYSGPYKHMWNSPVQGLTMLQSWQQFGISYLGDVLKESDAVDLDGLIDGKARAGLAVPFSPPRAVVTFPTMRAPALAPNGDDPAKAGYVKIWALITGDPNGGASNVMWYSVDGDSPAAWGAHGEQESGSDDRSFNTMHATPGVHTVKVWRTRADGKTPLPGSDFTSQYFVASRTQPSVTVPSLIGLTQRDAGHTLSAVLLAIGSVTSANSETVPSGHVVSQSPDAGALVVAGAGISLVLSAGATRHN